MRILAMMKVRKVEERDSVNTSGECDGTITLTPIQTGEALDADMEEFTKWTPDGETTMRVTNPSVVAAMRPGKTYKVTFEEVLQEAGSAQATDPAEA